MEWTEPKNSKERVKKAGAKLLNTETNLFSSKETFQEFEDAVSVFHNWRAAHAFPMHIMLNLLRKSALRVDGKAVAVQRLKRVSSILEKLDREESMNLSRMEDIAGCRVVVENTSCVNRVYDSLKNSRTKNVLSRERNYILQPKESGYRGIHLVYKYGGSKEKFKGMPVELQIRSKVQHSWATAVEVVGTFTKQALKASAGEQDWLDLFKYVSVEFSKLEESYVDPRYEGVDTFSLMVEHRDKLALEDRLQAFKVATKALAHSKNGSAVYFVLMLDLDKNVVRYTQYGRNQLQEATYFYDDQEATYRKDTNKEIVLVSAKSIRELKKAYPNYFADTDEFKKNIHKIIEANRVAKGV